MLIQYIKFFLNGSVLGAVAWCLQLLIYRALDDDSGMAYGAATALTYLPLVVINFFVQRTWIFNRPGYFVRFVIANISIMFLVSLMSPVFRHLLNMTLSPPWGDRGGFIVAALVGSVPSFILKRAWVFRAL